MIKKKRFVCVYCVQINGGVKFQVLFNSNEYFVSNPQFNYRNCFLTWISFTSSGPSKDKRKRSQYPSLCVGVCVLPGCSPHWACQTLGGSFLLSQSPALILQPSDDTKQTSHSLHNIDFVDKSSDNGKMTKTKSTKSFKKIHTDTAACTYKLCEFFGQEQLPTHSVPVKRTGEVK